MRNAEKFTQIFLAGAVVAVLTTGFNKGIVRVVATTPRTTTSDTVPAPTSLKEAEGATTRVSVASDGTEGNGNSQLSRIPPSISADGRFVTFISEASNLVSGDTNGQNDIFVHDRQNGQTTRVSVASDGTEGNECSWYPSISADGRYVAFESIATNLVAGDTNEGVDIFVRDRRLTIVYLPLIFR